MDGPHPEAWWIDKRHPQREHLLTKVLYERLRDDSEDENGNKVYVKERCALYKQLLSDLDRQKALVEQRRERVIKENARLKELGRPAIALPSVFKVDKAEMAAKMKEFEDVFLRRQYDKKEREIVEAGFGNDALGSQVGGHDPNHPLCWQQLNISVNNLAM